MGPVITGMARHTPADPEREGRGARAEGGSGARQHAYSRAGAPRLGVWACRGGGSGRDVGMWRARAVPPNLQGRAGGRHRPGPALGDRLGGKLHAEGGRPRKATKKEGADDQHGV